MQFMVTKIPKYKELKIFLVLIKKKKEYDAKRKYDEESSMSENEGLELKNLKELEDIAINRKLGDGMINFKEKSTKIQKYFYLVFLIFSYFSKKFL